MIRLDLDFSKFSAEQILENYSNVVESDWAKETLDFLKAYTYEKHFDCYTSGTTGISKKITFSKSQLQYSAATTLQFFKLQKGDPVLLSLSVNFIAGKMMLVRSVEGKLKLTVVSPSSNPLNFIKKEEQFKFTPLVPLQLFEMLNSKVDIHQLGKLLIGGGEVNKSLIQKLKDNNTEAWSSFGMTETITHFALKQISPIQEKKYTCLPDFHLDVNENNCLIIRNSVLFEKHFVSTDVVELLSSTTFNWLGRFDNVINSGGVKISPEVIEQKIKHLIPVEFIITSILDEKLGQKLILLYEGNSFEFSSEIIQKIKKLLTPYEFPKTFVSITTFPKTLSGKIRRKNIKI